MEIRFDAISLLYSFFISFSIAGRTVVLLHIVLLYLLCYLLSLVGRQFGGFLRAELSSNCFSRNRGVTVQRNSSRDLRTRSGKDLPFGTTTAFGPYENSMFEFNHYASGGVRATSTLVLVPSTSTSGSNRRVPPPRGLPPRTPLSGIPFVRVYSRSALFLPHEAFPHAEGRRLRIRASCGSALPSSGPTSSFLRSSMRVQYLFRGGRTCFPDRD